MKRVLLNAVLALGLASFGAMAAPLTLTFTFNGTPSTTQGGTATLNATATNNSGSTLFLNSDSFTLPTGLINLNDSLFFNNWPLSLANLATFTGNIFTVGVAANATLGLKTGTFNILGGTTVNDSNVIGTAQFSVNVVAPEPAAGISMALGLSALLFMRARQRA